METHNELTPDELAALRHEAEELERRTEATDKSVRQTIANLDRIAERIRKTA